MSLVPVIDLENLTMTSQKTINSSVALDASAIGLDPAQYQAALQYLFDRPVPQVSGSAWYWDMDEPEFEASPLEWTRIQTLVYSRAGTDLLAFDNEQVGMGLDFLMSNSISDVPFAAIHETVALHEAMQMMDAFKFLWRDCIGPRLSGVFERIGYGDSGTLGHVCYMWFDVWPTFWNVRHLSSWRDALWIVLDDMLGSPFRAVQISALHGIGHNKRYLERDALVDGRIDAFIRELDKSDVELKNYALAARSGMVQ